FGVVAANLDYCSVDPIDAQSADVPTNLWTMRAKSKATKFGPTDHAPAWSTRGNGAIQSILDAGSLRRHTHVARLGPMNPSKEAATPGLMPRFRPPRSSVVSRSTHSSFRAIR